jgi:hypothetical protein
METVNKIELSDESVYPDETVLRGVLGRSYQAYCALLELFDRHQMLYEWRYYRDGKSWLCKVQKKKRTIVWMSAWKGFMKAAIYIPERHLDRVYALPIHEETKDRIKTTKNVGKSRPCIFEIRDQRILKDMEVVIQFKIQTK